MSDFHGTAPEGKRIEFHTPLWATEEEKQVQFHVTTLSADAVSRRAKREQQFQRALWETQNEIAERAQKIAMWCIDQDPESVLDIAEVHKLALNALALVSAVQGYEFPNGEPQAVSEAPTAAERVRMQDGTDPRD